MGQIRLATWKRSSSLVLLCLLLAGCAGPLSTRTAGVDYNRSFAGARNDLILLNILRASEREALQFSTINSVAGPTRPSATLTLPFTNVIAGGPDIISPQIVTGIRNPNVTISPLESREFLAGIVRPVSYETIANLMETGPWPADAAALAVGGVTCSDNRRVINAGDSRDLDDRFRQVLGTDVQDFEWRPSEFMKLRLSAATAMGHLDDSLVGGRRIVSVVPAPSVGKGAESTAVADDVIVTIQGSESPQLAGAYLSDICRATGSAADVKATGVIMRSIQSMFYYLGEVHRRNSAQPEGSCRPFLGATRETAGLAPFRLNSRCDAGDAPVNAAVSAEFHGRLYYVLRHEDANVETASSPHALCRSAANALRSGVITVPHSATPSDESLLQAKPASRQPPSPARSLPPLERIPCDRTLVTLSLLSELIALQTTDATLATSRPVITLPSQ